MYPGRHVSTMFLRHFGNFSWRRDPIRKGMEFDFRRWNDSVRALARLCTRQFEFVIAQRFRRTIQIFHFYSRIWNETALKEFVRSWHQKIWHRRPNSLNFLVGSVFVTSYDWEKDRISDQEMYSYRNDLDRICKLKNSTVTCPKCHLRLVIDVVQPQVMYCKCGDEECKPVNSENEEWEPFLERQDMLVWRRIEPNTNGLYSYTVYGSFNDVSAEDFLQVQIDINYRKEWDQTAKELIILETDPSICNNDNGNSDIIYWEMIWPKLFANRDYVYQRRWIKDEQEGIIIIISKVTEHPNAPVRPDTHRVSSYWSYMVIKPYTKFNEDGIEFALTYFDDPGINIPNAITSWVAMRGFPDYLCRMREASKNYKTYKASKEKLLNVPDFTDENQKEQLLDQNETNISNETKLNDNVNEKRNLNEKETLDSANELGTNSDETLNSDSESKTDSNGETVTNESELDKAELEENQGFLNYFFYHKRFCLKAKCVV